MSPITFPSIDPVIFALGPLQVRWYGLMYVLGFTMSYLLVQRQIRLREDRELAQQHEKRRWRALLGRMRHRFARLFSVIIPEARNLEVAPAFERLQGLQGSLRLQ